MNLQNISTGDPKHQGIAAALTVSEKMLKSKGASRVHGGGFAGTVLAFVPDNLLDEYKTRLNAVFGGGAVKILNIRQAGGYCF
jgi:galactokinase